MKDSLRKNLSAFVRKRPSVLYHLPTWRCDCKCEFCNVWQEKPEDPSELEPEQINNILVQAYESGFTTYTIWGGEPLYYPGITQIINKADELGFRTIMCTNGGRLKEMSKELAPGIHRILLSLDAVGERHNKMRKNPGLFERALAGVEALRSANSKIEIVLWCNLNKKNQDQVLELCRLASELKAYIEFFPTINLGYHNESILDVEEKEELFQELINLKRQGYSITNTTYGLNLMKDSVPFRCNIPRVAVQLLWNGSLWPCLWRLPNTSESYGTYKDIDFKKLFSQDEYKHYVKKLEQCNSCLLPCVSHYANNLWLQGIRRLFNHNYYLHAYSFPST